MVRLVLCHFRDSRRALLSAFLAMLLSACVSFPDAPARSQSPDIDDNGLKSFDGAVLGLTVHAADAPRAAVIALHGMNDYARAFAPAGDWWSNEAGLLVYALDLRGHGRSPDFGRWAGADVFVDDLRAAIMAVREEHPDMPIFLVGHSAGAALIMAAAARAPLHADGIILAAPAVWGDKAMPIFYRLSLNIAATVAPGKTLTGERAGRQSTDNIDVLRDMVADPLVIKETRMDAILGVVRLMGEANRAAENICGSILVLIGEKDEIIPLEAMEQAASKLKGDVDVRRYPEGWHLLFRDHQAKAVWQDIADWIADRSAQRDIAALQCAS
ncbi:MAG: alpha/beta fold hydrolase [Pseudomonadota bacterium]